MAMACDILPPAIQAFSRTFQAMSEPHPRAEAIVNDVQVRRWWLHMQGIDLLTGGFPCQPFNGAVGQAGDKDPGGIAVLHTLDMRRLIRAPFLVLECVWAYF